MVDDDTFVFHRNLASNLASLDSSTPIYTGDVIPEAWLPVDRDGSGNVSSAAHSHSPPAWKKAPRFGSTQHVQPHAAGTRRLVKHALCEWWRRLCVQPSSRRTDEY